MAYGVLAVLDGGSVSRDMGSDIIGTTYHLRQKMQWGPEGTVNEVDVATPMPIQGPAAENAAAASNPLLTGGRYDASDRTLGDGAIGALAVTLKGILKTVVTDTSGVAQDPVPQAVLTYRTVDKVLTVQTAAYIANDVMVVPEVLAAAAPENDVAFALQSLTFCNEDDEAPAMDVYFFSSASASLGTINLAVAISDDDARTAYGPIRVAASDWVDMGGVRIATISAIGLGMQPVSGTDDIYIGIVTQSATTFAATNDLSVRACFQ